MPSPCYLPMLTAMKKSHVSHSIMQRDGCSLGQGMEQLRYNCLIVIINIHTWAQKYINWMHIIFAIVVKKIIQI